jgi:hypothetical protein
MAMAKQQASGWGGSERCVDGMVGGVFVGVCVYPHSVYVVIFVGVCVRLLLIFVGVCVHPHVCVSTCVCGCLCFLYCTLLCWSLSHHTTTQYSVHVQPFWPKTRECTTWAIARTELLLNRSDRYRLPVAHRRKRGRRGRRWCREQSERQWEGCREQREHEGSGESSCAS